MILTAEVSGGSHGGRIFRSSDFAKNFIQTNLPFHPLTQMMYSPQNSDHLLALSTEVSLVEELVLVFAFLWSQHILSSKDPVGDAFMLDCFLVTSYGMKYVFLAFFSCVVKGTIFMCYLFQVSMMSNG